MKNIAVILADQPHKIIVRNFFGRKRGDLRMEDVRWKREEGRSKKSDGRRKRDDVRGKSFECVNA